MTDLSDLSDAHSILLAVQLCLNGDISALPSLQAKFPNALPLRLLLRIILTFLPESTEPARYTLVVESLVDGSTHPSEPLDIDTSSVQEISKDDARRQIRHLRLLPLSYSKAFADDTTSPLVQFIIHRAHRIDTEIGAQPFLLDLVEPFIQTSDILRDWYISTILPALRFNYEYHPDKGGALSLEVMESLDSGSAVNILLSAVERRQNGGDVGRDLRGLIGPWIYGHAKSKRQKLSQISREGQYPESDDINVFSSSSWQDVNEWLLSTSIRDFSLAVEAIEDWSGPKDFDLGGYNDQEENALAADTMEATRRYAQAGLASIYALLEVDPTVIDGASRISTRIAALQGMNEHSTSRVHGSNTPSLNLDLSSFENCSRRWFLHNMLLEPTNPLTSPNAQALAFINAILASIHILDGLGRSVSPQTTAETVLLSNDETQLFELRELLETINRRSQTPRDWRRVREQLLWLRNWGRKSETSMTVNGSHPQQGLFWRIPLHRFEREILIAILGAKQYKLAVDIYASSSDPSPLSHNEVEAAVTETIFVSYDNATNGNKTRGGMKRAVEMLDSFSPCFPDSTSFHKIKSLISATHALSFYSLTLQHGVPFQPVSIRVHQDPLSLIGKVLEQNPQGYTQLDNLLAIGHDLISAGFSPIQEDNDTPFHGQKEPTLEEACLAADRRIMSLAISSAVEAGDFDTAYSYIVTRLVPDPLAAEGSANSQATEKDNISWLAAYNAGRHRPAMAGSVNTTLESRIARLSQRMELLSLAMILVPYPEHLPEILAVWRRCDEEMTSLQEQELQEAESWDTRGDKTSMSLAPGAFGPTNSELDAMDTEQERKRRLRSARIPRGSKLSGYEEAPMGLFDVARGAAEAISKNTFPLRGTAAAEQMPSNIDTDADAARTRKRDVVSNMVTGGLVSGIGWVLGAPANTDTSNGAPE